MSANTENNTANTARQWDNGDETTLNFVLKSVIKSESSSAETEAEEL
jgi:hypothetical protein